jgi:indole-3-glycerol phosphate synthase
MEVLFEVHNEEELLKVSDYVKCGGLKQPRPEDLMLIFQQSVKNFRRLIPGKFIKISESGISDPETVKMLKTHGYQGFLMGENFMKEDNPGEAFLNFVQKIK